MDDNKILDNLIRLLPYWHYKIERPIKQTQKHHALSYEAYYCLIALFRHGPMSMSELAASLRMTKQQATQIVDRLYRHELIGRVNDPVDRRVIRIEISVDGQRFLEENNLDAQRIKEQIILPQNERDREDLLKATELLLRILPDMK